MAGNELATAYLALVPSLKGAQKSIEQQLNGIDTTRSGEKMGDKMGDGASKKIGAKLKSGLKTAAASAGVAAGVAFAGAFAIGKQSLDSFANYEQLVGGAEKIFDEIDQKAILEDAGKAYLDLNMSANEYLETINQTGAAFASTMGDAKGYDTARKGMLAISDYASGTGRNLDELMEKYSLITRSSASYQSIADQFSGILPATSTAFLEQAQAAGLLSDEYAKLTEVPIDEYQQAVTEMLERGVEGLGLAGNTAAETAGTISGSLAALSGAWSNWLTGLADENADLQALTNQLVDTVITAASNVIPRLGVILATLGVAIGEQIPILLADVKAKLSSDGPAMAEAALELFGEILTALVSLTPDILAALGLLLASLVVAAVNKGVEFGTAAGEWLVKMGGAIAENAHFVVDEIERGINDGVEKVKSKVQDFVNAGKSIIEGLAQGIRNAISSVTGAISDVLAKVREYLPFSPAKKGPFSGKGWTLFSGISIGTGLAEGILQSAGVVTKAIDSLTADAASAVSKVTKPTLGVGASFGGASLSGAYAGASSTTNNQTINIYQPVKSAAEMRRAWYMQQTYGLAGAR